MTANLDMIYRMYVIGLKPVIPEPEMKRLIESAHVCAVSENGQTWQIGQIVTVSAKLAEASHWDGPPIGELGQQFIVIGYEANGRICLVRLLDSQ